MEIEQNTVHNASSNRMITTRVANMVCSYFAGIFAMRAANGGIKIYIFCLILPAIGITVWAFMLSSITKPADWSFSINDENASHVNIEDISVLFAIVSGMSLIKHHVWSRTVGSMS